MVGLVAVSLSVGLVSPRPLLFRPHLAPAASLHGAANFAAASPLRGLRCSVETDESLDTAEPEPEVVVAVVADSVVLEDEDGEPLTVEEAENREISALALPALVNTLIDPILSLIDTVVISRLASTIALGAVAASSELFTLCFAVSLALRESASSTISRLVGAGRGPEAARFAVTTLKIAAAAGVLLAFVIAGPAAPWCVGLLGAHAGSPLHTPALAYARARAIGLPFSLTWTASEGIFRGLADTRVPLRASAVAAVVNLVLDPLFVFEPLNWGVAGAAVATAASCVAACFVLIRSLKPRLDALAVRKSQTVELTTDAAAERAANRAVAGTSAATLLRTSSILGYWVFVAAGVSRSLGPAAIAAHGVVLKARAAPRRAARPLLARAARRLSHPSTPSPHPLPPPLPAPLPSPPPSPPSAQVWLLFVLSCEAPGVAGQVLCARRLAEGADERARLLLLRLLRISLMLGVFAGAGIGLIGAPLARFFLPGDPATAATATRLFGWAALSAPLVCPTVLLEASLLGAGRSYKFLASMTLANALGLGAATHLALRLRPDPTTAWVCIISFFALRVTTAGLRLFSPAGGFGFNVFGFGRGDPTLPRELGGAEGEPAAPDASEADLAAVPS